MNAYLIAAKANAYEISTHVGHALDARQSAYEMEALGRGAGSDRKTHARMTSRARIFGGRRMR
ncbi:hypothetical protein [Xiamenia xianingshaonis]|uniref:Uncharacterized protein n=1 Tax=Xiamenia xianingshaonis TaxID=2682776 RepID=A0A9E6MS99_9ACTN|nr:hypothetical protein [Xiamenia xianingshaonis]NGM16932.1 hypothetical protein [Eggerthellaceae bacterium zg-893]NHM14812.1 hypothetical protein [Xiamenia xianingshaonis]NHM16842.1 hypothetical protein [Xiamenia xianingshaonis]QTU84781.1 hypothetical protein J7S26_02340 [Xiamenia xianingshaonis]